MVLAVILLAPIVLRRLRIPSIIGLIVAGIVLGEHGLGLIERDRSFEIFGQVGIYLIMFMAGLGLNMGSVKRYGREGLLFGVLTFLVPFFMGLATSYWMLGLGWTTSMLMACIFSSHTLVTYPVVQRYSLSRHPKVVVSVVATAFTTFLSLLILAVVIDMENARSVWDLSRLALSIVLYGGAMLYCVPRVGRWFLRRYDEPITQFIFMLLLLFLSAALARLAGIAPLLGAFLCGLLVNRLIPRMSPLMHRIEFIGNAIFIPYFLIGVGMLINIRALFTSLHTAYIVLIIVVIGTLGKMFAGYIANIAFRLPLSHGNMMFGLTSAHAAGSIAIVMVGMKMEIIPGVALVDAEMLNGVVMMILFTCIISSIVSEMASRQIVLHGDIEEEDTKKGDDEKILIPLKYQGNMETLVSLAIMMRNERLNRGLIGLSVVLDDQNVHRNQALGKRLLEQAVIAASAADVRMQTQSRIATNVANGMAIREFGLFFADNTLFSRRVRKSTIGKEDDIQITGYWEIYF